MNPTKNTGIATTSDGFEIRCFRAEDEPMLNKAWQEAYPDLFAFKYPDRWRWNMLGNPFVPEEKRPLCWVASKDGEIAAWSTAMAVPMIAAGQRLTGGHSCDTYTLERYRRYGLGKKLQEFNQEAHNIFIAIDPSPSNRRNKYKVGGYPGKPLDTWLRIGSRLDREVLYASFLRLATKYLGTRGERLLMACKNFGPAMLINYFCSTAMRFRQRQSCSAIETSGGVTFQEVDTFDARVDTLWNQIVSVYSFAISRESSYLNWKYVRQPNMTYRKFLILRNEAPVGLLIYRFPVSHEQQVGIISECFCLDDDPTLHAALVAYAIKDFENHGIDNIKCGASTENQRKALQNLGFGLVDIDVPVFHISPNRADLKLKDLMAKDWLLSLGDSDIDQIRPEHQPTFVEIIRILRGKVPGSEHLSG